MEQEIWKSIKDFENYEISNFGNIRRLHKIGYRYRKLVEQHGYYHITLPYNNGINFKSFQVHRLVAMHFIQNAENKLCVNHIDGNKKNNFSDNLEWCTHSENERHSYNVLGKKSPATKLKKEDVLDIKNNAKKSTHNYRNKGNIKEYAIKYNVQIATIHNILNNKTHV